MKKQLAVHHIPLAFGLLCLVLAGIFLNWRLVPPPRMVKTLQIPSGSPAISADGSTYLTPSDLSVTFDTPTEIKAGIPAQVTVKISTSAQDETRLPLTAELTTLGSQQNPQGIIQSVLTENHETHLGWTISSTQTGKYEGNFWLSIIPAEGVEAALLSLNFEGEVLRLWGMPAKTVTLCGFAALAAWAACMIFSRWLEHTRKAA